MDLDVDNIEIARVFMACRGQIITAGMGKVVDISLPAVCLAMDLYGVRDRARCWDSVRKLFCEIVVKRQDAPQMGGK